MDLVIFLVFIYEIVVAIRVENKNSVCSNDNLGIVNKDEVRAVMFFIILATGLRIYYIPLGILYLLFIWPINFCPSCCVCKKWLQGDDLIEEVML